MVWGEEDWNIPSSEVPAPAEPPSDEQQRQHVIDELAKLGGQDPLITEYITGLSPSEFGALIAAGGAKELSAKINSIADEINGANTLEEVEKLSSLSVPSGLEGLKTKLIDSQKQDILAKQAIGIDAGRVIEASLGAGIKAPSVATPSSPALNGDNPVIPDLPPAVSIAAVNPPNTSRQTTSTGVQPNTRESQSEEEEKQKKKSGINFEKLLEIIGKLLGGTLFADLFKKNETEQNAANNSPATPNQTPVAPQKVAEQALNAPAPQISFTTDPKVTQALKTAQILPFPVSSTEQGVKVEQKDMFTGRISPLPTPAVAPAPVIAAALGTGNNDSGRGRTI